MAVELSFWKADATPWGFRLTGGADHEAPLTVVKVSENSLAEDAGMQVGDVILRINDVATKKLTHAQAHDIILKAGNEFVLGVRRGGLLNLPRRLSSETSADDGAVTNAKAESRTKTEKEDQDLNITDEEIADIIGEPLQNPHADKTNEESEVLQAVTAEDAENKLKAKKWSTFLQKPKNPIPKPRRPIEEGPKGPPYRVIIKKQPKKIPGTSDEPIADKTPEETKLEPEDQSEEERGGEEEEEEEEDEQKGEDPQQSDGDIEKEDGETPRQSPTQSDAEEHEDLQSPAQFHDEDEEQDSSLKESDIRRMSASLEEQLVQVQKQLLALSKLPSAIQSTLNAVTQQLELIVSITQHEEEEVVQVVEEEGGEEEVYEEKALSTLDEEEASDLAEARREDEEEEVCSETTEDFVREEERQIMTEEELEAQREEQERLEKREKELRERARMDEKFTLTPLERPIILPGGRRWVQADDAVSKIRRPSMTDERIANTINTYTEVNHWNHIWPWSDVAKPVYRINFLKYQPPPKNLDHLQRSDVYRMIHDMEPPVRGIKAREMKVLAEQDYYATKEESVASLSPQMER